MQSLDLVCAHRRFFSNHLFPCFLSPKYPITCRHGFERRPHLNVATPPLQRPQVIASAVGTTCGKRAFMVLRGMTLQRKDSSNIPQARLQAKWFAQHFDHTNTDRLDPVTPALTPDSLQLSGV